MCMRFGEFCGLVGIYSCFMPFGPLFFLLKKTYIYVYIHTILIGKLQKNVGKRSDLTMAVVFMILKIAR